MVLKDKTFPDIVGKVFYFPEYNGSKPVFKDKESAVEFRKTDKELKNVEPKEGCVLSYNMVCVPALDKNDYQGDIPERFQCTNAVAYYKREKPQTPEFFACSLDVAGYEDMIRDGNDVSIHAKFKIIPVLELDDVKNE